MLAQVTDYDLSGSRKANTWSISVVLVYGKDGRVWRKLAFAPEMLLGRHSTYLTFSRDSTYAKLSDASVAAGKLKFLRVLYF
jgi:tellurite resistance-related uncharacterized protein